MEGKRHSIKRAGITVMGFVVLISITVVAQEVRSEVSVQGTGFFTKDSNRNGILNNRHLIWASKPRCVPRSAREPIIEDTMRSTRFWRDSGLF
jgi:hypothetical protein